MLLATKLDLCSLIMNMNTRSKSISKQINDMANSDILKPLFETGVVSDEPITKKEMFCHLVACFEMYGTLLNMPPHNNISKRDDNLPSTKERLIKLKESSKRIGDIIDSAAQEFGVEL